MRGEQENIRQWLEMGIPLENVILLRRQDLSNTTAKANTNTRISKDKKCYRERSTGKAIKN